MTEELLEEGKKKKGKEPLPEYEPRILWVELDLKYQRLKHHDLTEYLFEVDKDTNRLKLDEQSRPIRTDNKLVIEKTQQDIGNGQYIDTYVASVTDKDGKELLGLKPSNITHRDLIVVYEDVPVENGKVDLEQFESYLDCSVIKHKIEPAAIGRVLENSSDYFDSKDVKDPRAEVVFAGKKDLVKEVYCYGGETYTVKNIKIDLKPRMIPLDDNYQDISRDDKGYIGTHAELTLTKVADKLIKLIEKGQDKDLLNPQSKAFGKLNKASVDYDLSFNKHEAELLVGIAKEYMQGGLSTTERNAIDMIAIKMANTMDTHSTNQILPNNSQKTGWAVE